MLNHLVNSSMIQKAYLFDVLSKVYIATDENPVDVKEYEICSELIDVLIDVSCIYGADEAGDLQFDDKSSSQIRLHYPPENHNIMLYLREVDKCLALVCLIDETKVHNKHLLNYNIDLFKTGL